jgi:hypothetical protein
LQKPTENAIGRSDADQATIQAFQTLDYNRKETSPYEGCRYTTIIELAESLTRWRGSALDYSPGWVCDILAVSSWLRS